LTNPSYDQHEEVKVRDDEVGSLRFALPALVGAQHLGRLAVVIGSPDVKLTTTGEKMRDRIIVALDPRSSS
jgi:hypothetical protein